MPGFVRSCLLFLSVWSVAGCPSLPGFVLPCLLVGCARLVSAPVCLTCPALSCRACLLESNTHRSLPPSAWAWRAFLRHTFRLTPVLPFPLAEMQPCMTLTPSWQATTGCAVRRAGSARHSARPCRGTCPYRHRPAPPSVCAHRLLPQVILPQKLRGVGNLQAKQSAVKLTGSERGKEDRACAAAALWSLFAFFAFLSNSSGRRESEPAFSTRAQSSGRG